MEDIQEIMKLIGVFGGGTQEILAVIVVVSSVVLTLVKRLPTKAIRALLHTYRRGQQLNSFKKGSNINNIIRKLLATKALSIFIIRYHNGGPFKLTVEWEAVGSACGDCSDQCEIGRHAKVTSVQKDWQGEKITNLWNELVVSETVAMDYKINTVSMSDFDAAAADPKSSITSEEVAMTKLIWKESGIWTMKETLIALKSNKEVWTLAMTFCHKHKHIEESDLAMTLAARRLRKLF